MSIRRAYTHITILTLSILWFLLACEEQKPTTFSREAEAKPLILAVMLGDTIHVPFIDDPLILDKIEDFRFDPDVDTWSCCFRAEVDLRIVGAEHHVILTIGPTADSGLIRGPIVHHEQSSFQILSLSPENQDRPWEIAPKDYICSLKVSRESDYADTLEKPSLSLSAGDYWIYRRFELRADSIMSETEDTMRVTRTFVDAVGSWASLSKGIHFIYNPEVMSVGEQLFDRSTGFAFEAHGEPGARFQLLFPVVDTIPEKQWFIFEGDIVIQGEARKLDSSLSLPVGTFKNVTKYKIPAFWVMGSYYRVTSYFDPRVGVVQVESEPDYRLNDSTFTGFRSLLIEYKLNGKIVKESRNNL